MKRTNLILLCFMAYVPVFSQVDTIADNIYEHNGSLGIGINEPQNAISIEGNEDEWPGRIFLSISNRSVSNKSFAYLRISSGESGNGTHLGHISETFTANGSPEDIQDYGRLTTCGRGLMIDATKINQEPGIIKFCSGINNTLSFIERMRIDTSGNIGIGTKNPISRLEVKGMIHSTSEGFKFPDGTIQTTAASGGDPSYWNLSGNDIFYNNGKVGIGTSLPDVRLRIEDSVDGGPERALIRLKNLSTSNTSSVSLGLESNNSENGLALTFTSEQFSSIPNFDRMGVIRVNGRGFSVYSTSDYGSIRFYTNMDQNGIIERMRINHDGNVGIGTKEPGAKVEIASGDIFISDINSGIIMKSPDGKCWRGTLDNSGTLIFTAIHCPGETQIPINLISPTTSKITIFPNPAENTVTIASLDGNFRNTEAIIYTMDGKVVKKNELNGELSIVNISNIPAGSYILRVLDKRGREMGSGTILKN